MKENGSIVRRFFVHFFRATLMLWGLLVPAAMVQIYYNGRASIADPDFVDDAMVACFFIPIGALVLAYLIIREEGRKSYD